MTYENIQDALSAAGIEVRYPGIKQGICTSPYAVIQDLGTYPYAESNRLGYTVVGVHCYAPLNQYPELYRLIKRVKSALETLAPDLRPTGNESNHTINNDFRAHESYVEYMIQKRLF